MSQDTKEMAVEDDNMSRLYEAVFDGVQECDSCGNQLEPDCMECSCGETTLTAKYGLF